jgi:hypothetical protein
MRVLLWLGWGIVAAAALGEFLGLDKLGGARGPRPEGEARANFLRYGRLLSV